MTINQSPRTYGQIDNVIRTQPSYLKSKRLSDADNSFDTTEYKKNMKNQLLNKLVNHRAFKFNNVIRQ